jgi:16S rRNA (adenine1518-N6/adenine1519-N6)-dimethyltransferase
MAKIYKPSALIAFLEEHGISAKKRFSQNFLIDYNILKKIVSAAHIQEGDLVLEIGAGPGALTEILLEAKANVIAIELDPDFARVLDRLQDDKHSLEILEGDALKIDLEELCRQKAGHKKIKVVANLPYHITTPILTRLLPMHRWVESLTVMVQKEFAERMAAKAGTSSYSSFSVFLQFYSAVKLLFTISPSCFYPAPKVHSAIVHCALHPPALKEMEEKHFFTMTRTAFGQRRKMLRSTLKSLYPVQCIDAALEKMHLDLKVRPEELSLSQFLTLFHFLPSAMHDKGTYKESST